MINQLEELRLKALNELEGVKNIKELETWQVRYLGRKGELTGILRSLGSLPLEERKTAGARANTLKTSLESSLKEKEQALREAELALSKKEVIDVTLPGRPYPAGRVHPITQTIHEICDIFVSLGFQIVEGPEVEWEYYNFEALNMPAEHPARDSQSTYWIDWETEDGKKPMLLRTQGTAITARVIEKMKPPIRTIEPGRVYRYEASDATHLSIYHNIDGLVVGKSVTMADLKGTLYEFARRYFGEDRKVRFRCDYFPFVEPGVEMAIDCLVCNGEGCRLCGNSGWIEILGAGMTHPRVLERGGIDPNVYTSFAFGMGVERMPMLRYGIDDIRLFYSSDLRFLRQF
ncbi:MAG: phenylalanine--tRNA ligase subunit alpha [Dehalococcoidales bacterium]|nr:phenylalanine--tRNA ligase subunit alpha [Dehalococcoidales bacterium]